MGRIEIHNVGKIFSVKIFLYIQTAAAHQHKCHAVDRKPLIQHFNVVFIQSL